MLQTGTRSLLITGIVYLSIAAVLIATGKPDKPILEKGELAFDDLNLV